MLALGKVYLNAFLDKAISPAVPLRHSPIRCYWRGNVLQYRFYVESHHAMITGVNSQPNKLISHLLSHLSFLSNLGHCIFVGKGF